LKERGREKKKEFKEYEEEPESRIQEQGARRCWVTQRQ
jgi:hypothetical protein